MTVDPHGEIHTYLQRVTEIAPAMIYVYNQVAQCNEYSNRNVGDTLGYSPAEVVDMGKGLMLEVLHPDDQPSVFEHFAKIRDLKDGQTASIEYRMRHKNGTWLWLLSSDTVFRRDASGAVTHHIGSAVDITAQKNAEAAALAAEERARIVNEELRDFSYSVSHDLKAPANTLQMLLSELALTEGKHPDPLAEILLEDCAATVNGMKTLIDDVLHYTEIIGQVLDHEQVDLDALLHQVKRGIRAEIKRTGASVRIDPLPHVSGIGTQLTILFQNLILNAIKFSRPGCAPEVNITAELSSDGECVKVSVSDNGIGIPAQKKEEIFQIFKRLNPGSEFAGSGLGLAICRRVARNHQSSVEVDSVPGEGSVFAVELQVLKA